MRIVARAEASHCARICGECLQVETLWALPAAMAKLGGALERMRPDPSRCAQANRWCRLDCVTLAGDISCSSRWPLVRIPTICTLLVGALPLRGVSVVLSSTARAHAAPRAHMYVYIHLCAHINPGRRAPSSQDLQVQEAPRQRGWT